MVNKIRINSTTQKGVTEIAEQGVLLGFVLADYFYKLFMNKGYLKIHDGGFR
jgi:hypothetical protein